MTITEIWLAYPSEVSNFFMLSLFLGVLGVVIKKAIDKRFFLWWRLVGFWAAFSSLFLSLRLYYYFGRVFWGFTRGVEGARFVSVPTIFVFLGLALLTASFLGLVAVSDGLEGEIKRLNDWMEESPDPREGLYLEIRTLNRRIGTLSDDIRDGETLIPDDLSEVLDKLRQLVKGLEQGE